ncbi:MAG: oxygen-independent coproporphyrinogen III oxidase [Deltaproteobacteria bacterium]|nr:oxygen-independent coproporphyrinogen III oxidase [Deltaproteobacteria bacterium]MBW2577655.1 oxygen-independent coproporphyrinogen III oxidase [Deltaproteobacteria bacterium]MBW2692977.1 oxygen-independent coproporphyrinogen III oxidase [Deltaproteobacteria bacterium]
MARDVFGLDLERIEEILPRYAIEGPRYTSYPTAPVWKEDFGVEQYKTELAGDAAEAASVADEGDGLSLYVHVPFCSSLCHFCACNRVITSKAELPLKFLDTIEREVAAVREASGPRTASQQHWGGGTPTHLTPDQVKRLFYTVTDAFPMRAGAEISIEVDPRVTTDEHVAALRECGFNRISLGVQDIDPKVQEAVHRIQPIEQTRHLVEVSRASGFVGVNFDLIYGLPYQTEESFSRTLDQVLEIEPDRLALYSYAHVTWIAKQQRGFEKKDLPDSSTKLRIMLMAIERFLEAGYRFIGLDHFAKPEDELSQALEDRTLRRNFMGHTTQAGVDLIGFGPSAISELRASYAQSQRNLGDWEDAVAERGLATMRGHHLTRDDIERRWVIGRLMCHGVLRAEEFEAAFGQPFATRFASELQQLDPFVADDLIERADDGSIVVLPLGRLLVRNVAMTFDAYLADQRKGDKPMFSKTV